MSYIAALMARPGESTPERFWRGGIFYVNPDDPALFVQKRIGIGYTLNFGNRWSWVILGLVLAMAAVPLVLTAISIGHLMHHNSGAPRRNAGARLNRLPKISIAAL